MKLSSKPISSPGRTDKFPPPLMRFLRSNTGNRSRGRSRSSPMFFLRKKNTTIETQEPSSPKVTCMGQVRVKRNTVKKGRRQQLPSTGAGAPTKCRCCCFWWVPQAMFCNRRKKPGSCCNCQCQQVRFNWGFFGRRRRRKNSDIAEASANFRDRSKIELEKEETEVKANFFVSNSSSTPPRNALLLTRCRSAPYSSSSLASRFWGSPLRNEEEEEEKTEVENREPSENPNQRSTEPVSEQEEERLNDTKLELKLRFFKELEDSLREKIMESEKLKKGKEETEDGDSVRPLVLTRCKSEPARTARKLDTCSPHGFD